MTIHTSYTDDLEGIDSSRFDEPDPATHLEIAACERSEESVSGEAEEAKVSFEMVAKNLNAHSSFREVLLRYISVVALSVKSNQLTLKIL